MKSSKTKDCIVCHDGASSVPFGRRELAKYTETPIPRYQGNPLIEALPPILSESQISDALAYYPPFDVGERALSPELRIHLIHTILDLLVPFPEHIDLAQRFSCLILEGYTARNPIAANYWAEFRVRTEADGEEIMPRVRVRSSARGMVLLGISGGGKTTATEAALDLYPQVIQHSEYRGRPFTWTQLVWLKLQCPHDGSIRGLCLNFFQTIDELLGTNHYRNYAEGRKTTDELIPKMQRVASLLSIGILVIDELQHLDQSKSGGKDRMLNFFTQLVNTIGVAVLFIGTPKAQSVLSREFRQSRRGTGEGDFVWERLENDEKWQYFMESLWGYQYLRNPVRPSKEFFDVTYDESQGIVDIAVKVFMLSQVRAIRTGLETLTPAVIKSVARDSLRTIHTALDALRRGDYETLAEMPDIQPIDYAAAVRKISNSARLANLAAQRRPCVIPQPEAQATEPSASESKLISANAAHAAVWDLPSTGSLMGIVKQANAMKTDSYEALKAHGLVRDSSDYLEDVTRP
jgi:hypothetical protein